MGQEIERKWVVKPHGNWLAGVTWQADLRTGYCSLTPEIRVREKRWDPCEASYTLTVKVGRGLVRSEYECPLSEAEAAELWPTCHGRLLRKTRYRLDRYDLDQYHGKLSGLYILECELLDVEEPLPPWPQDIRLWTEVTGQRAYSNAELANLDAASAQAIVVDSYRLS
jgi:CYTH domain-containing protein